MRNLLVAWASRPRGEMQLDAKLQRAIYFCPNPRLRLLSRVPTYFHVPHLLSDIASFRIVNVPMTNQTKLMVTEIASAVTESRLSNGTRV